MLHIPHVVVKLTGLILLSPLLLSAQFVSSTIWLDIRDDTGGHDSLVFGTHQFATYCVDTALGENVGPGCACPPAGLMADFQSIPGRVNCFGALGLWQKDLRGFSSVTKKDTFYVDFMNLDSIAQLPGVKTTLRWPDSAYLSQRCDSMFLQDREGGIVIPFRIDMFAQSSLVIWGVYDPFGANIFGPLVKLKIFRYGTHLPYVDGIQAGKQAIPKSFALYQNYPNPFNPATTIQYELPEAGHVKLMVYDLLGREIAILVNEAQPPGMYHRTFDAGRLATGVYFYTLNAGNYSETMIMGVLR